MRLFLIWSRSMWPVMGALPLQYLLLPPEQVRELPVALEQLPEVAQGPGRLRVRMNLFVLVALAAAGLAYWKKRGALRRE